MPKEIQKQFMIDIFKYGENLKAFTARACDISSNKHA